MALAKSQPGTQFGFVVDRSMRSPCELACATPHGQPVDSTLTIGKPRLAHGTFQPSQTGQPHRPQSYPCSGQATFLGTQCVAQSHPTSQLPYRALLVVASQLIANVACRHQSSSQPFVQRLA